MAHLKRKIFAKYFAPGARDTFFKYQYSQISTYLFYYPTFVAKTEKGY